MKKMFALILALAMVMTMGATVLADDGDVTVQVVQYDVQNVNISWTSMDFVYTYTAADQGSWNKNSVEFTVTNNSNYSVDITASVDTTDLDTVESVSASIEGEDEATLAVGANCKFTVKITGQPANRDVAKTHIGTVKIAIKKTGT